MTERLYTTPEVRTLLKLTPRTFRRLKHEGKLPFLEPLRPRLGRSERYLAAPLDLYLRGQWGKPQLVFGRRSAR